MLIGEHIRTARHFLTAADAEFADCDILQASEKMWGAASHAVIALAQRRVWPYGRHVLIRAAVRRLSEEIGDDSLIEGFKAAEKLHANFYHGFMNETELRGARRDARDFVNRILAIIDAGN